MVIYGNRDGPWQGTMWKITDIGKMIISISIASYNFVIEYIIIFFMRQYVKITLKSLK